MDRQDNLASRFATLPIGHL